MGLVPIFCWLVALNPRFLPRLPGIAAVQDVLKVFESELGVETDP